MNKLINLVAIVLVLAMIVYLKVTSSARAMDAEEMLKKVITVIENDSPESIFKQLHVEFSYGANKKSNYKIIADLKNSLKLLGKPTRYNPPITSHTTPSFNETVGNADVFIVKAKYEADNVTYKLGVIKSNDKKLVDRLTVFSDTFPDGRYTLVVQCAKKRQIVNNCKSNKTHNE